MRTTSLKTVLFSCILLLVLIARPFVCGVGAEEGKPVKIGIAATLTGDIGPWWKGAWDVGEIAFDLVNEDPPLGRPLEPIISDTESSPVGATKTAEYLAGQDVAFAIGYSSGGLWASLDVIERYGTPTFTQWAGSTRLDKTTAGKKKLFFRLCSSDSLLSALYAYYWEKEFAPKGLKKIAILSATDEASKSSTERGEQGLREIGAEIVYKTEFPPGQKTFSRVLADAFAKEPAAVFLGTSVSQGSIVTKEWWDSGLSKDIIWMVPEEWVLQSALEAVTPSPGALDDKMFSPSGGGGEALREYTARAYDIMMKRFKEVYGQDAELEHEYGVNMWDGIMVGALAIQAAGNPSPDAVSKSIIEVSSPPGVKVYSFSEGKKALEEGKDIDYEGAASDCNFDDWGNPYPPNGIYMVRGGKWQQIELISPDDQKAFVAKID